MKKTHDTFGQYKKCPVCGKTYYQPYGSWRYLVTRGTGHKEFFLCSYRCTNMLRRQLAEGAKGKTYKICGIRIIDVDPGEQHSLEEWSEMFDIDYFSLWEMVEDMKIGIQDAIYLLLEKKKGAM